MSFSKPPLFFTLFIIFTLTFLAYFPGTTGIFIFDDHPNILHNDAVAINDFSLSSLKTAFFSGNAGPLQRPIPMLSFAINHYLTGFDSTWFKLTNIVIHSVNAVLLFFLSHLLLRAYVLSTGCRLSTRHIFWLSLSVALAWSLHPINLTSVLYVVQRMNSLAALFTILSMITYASGRLKQLQGQPGWGLILTSFVVFAPMAVLSKENALLLPFFLTLIEASLFRFKNPSDRPLNVIVGIHILTAIIFLALTVYLCFLSPDKLFGGYLSRDFTLYERLLTQARVIWFYVSQITIPTNSAMSIHHDGFVLSKGLWDPPATLWAVLGLLSAASAALASVRYVPIPAFGVLFFLLGHGVESTVLPLEIAHEHRNYLPSFGLIFSGLFLVAHPTVLRDTLRLRAIAVALLIGVLGFATLVRAQIWGDPFQHAMFEVSNHPNSSRANLAAGQVYLQVGLSDAANQSVYFAGARGHFRRAGRLDESFVGGFFAEIFLDGKMGEWPSSDVIDELADRLENRPFSSVAVNWVDALAACVVNEECFVTSEDMHRIITAAINNETTRGRNRSELYVASSNYYFLIGDLDSAVYLVAQAVDSNPSIVRYRLNLINILIVAGRFQDAKQELALAASLDRLGVNRAEIERLDAILLGMAGSPGH